MSPVGSNLFEALRAGLADFRLQVEGEAGLEVRALGPSTGTVPDLVRRVLEALAEALAGLAGALEDAHATLRVADAAVALLETANAMLGGLATGLSFGELPQAFGLDPRPFEAVSTALEQAHDAVATGTRVVGLLPSPEDLSAIREELVLLLGQRVDPSRTDAGALGALLAAIQPSPEMN
ncbi:MAG TPA: hypothetical protein VLQ93_01060 [Myxococcaceae bacterium]|nr:hypothetical protein [Myxococcaceae bacterium]